MLQKAIKELKDHFVLIFEEFRLFSRRSTQFFELITVNFLIILEQSRSRLFNSFKQLKSAFYEFWMLKSLESYLDTLWHPRFLFFTLQRKGVTADIIPVDYPRSLSPDNFINFPRTLGISFLSRRRLDLRGAWEKTFCSRRVSNHNWIERIE